VNNILPSAPCCVTGTSHAIKRTNKRNIVLMAPWCGHHQLAWAECLTTCEVQCTDQTLPPAVHGKLDQCDNFKVGACIKTRSALQTWAQHPCSIPEGHHGFLSYCTRWQGALSACAINGSTLSGKARKKHQHALVALTWPSYSQALEQRLSLQHMTLVVWMLDHKLHRYMHSNTV
jgi:hypothetical protein